MLLKKLMTLCSKDTPHCIDVKCRYPRYVTEKEYSDEEYKAIRAEADKYEIYVYSSWGYDYGYGQEDSSTNEASKRIEDYQIVVSRDGQHFAGVADTSDYYGFNKESHLDKDLHVTLTDDPVGRWDDYPLISKTGSSFSSDDHSKWDYTYYYLREKKHKKAQKK